MARPAAVHLTAAHVSTDIRIFHKECRTLADAGWDVHLVAPHPGDEVIHGVSIHALPAAPGRFRRLTTSTWTVYRMAVRIPAAVYHLHDPVLLVVGLLLKLHGRRVVYDVHEDVPKQILGKHWIPRYLRPTTARLAQLFERGVARVVDGIVAATEPIARRFPSEKTVTVCNYPILTAFAADEDESADARTGSPVVAYVGGVSVTRCAREMVEAIGLVPTSLGARLLLAGPIQPPGLRDELARIPGAELADLLGWQDREHVVALLRKSEIGLVLCYPEPRYMEAQPTKLYEYMASGLPVVAADFPRWKRIVEDAHCGLVVDPRDPEAISQAITWLLQHPEEAREMGQRGCQVVFDRYSWETEAEQLRHFYRRFKPPD